jgi:hypothetical protein
VRADAPDKPAPANPAGAAPRPGEIVEHNGVTISLVEGEEKVVFGELEIEVKPRHARLVACLAAANFLPVGRDFIAKRVWVGERIPEFAGSTAQPARHRGEARARAAQAHDQDGARHWARAGQGGGVADGEEGRQGQVQKDGDEEAAEVAQAARQGAEGEGEDIIRRRQKAAEKPEVEIARKRPLATRLLGEIKLGKRFRKDLGDIEGLARSIDERGALLQPVVITPENKLIAGERRMAAWKISATSRSRASCRSRSTSSTSTH